MAADGTVCGAVVLQFDLVSEMQSIFSALRDPANHTTIVLLDASQRIVASSAPNRFTPRERLDVPAPAPVPAADAVSLLRYNGTDYLYAHCHTRGYQGYAGPGWTALSLVPLDMAFDASEGDPAETVLTNDYGIESDNPQLQSIVARARDIEKGLNRVIWNGKLSDTGVSSGTSMHPVFAEIGRTSTQTLSVFDSAILELRTPANARSTRRNGNPCGIGSQYHGPQPV